MAVEQHPALADGSRCVESRNRLVLPVEDPKRAVNSQSAVGECQPRVQRPQSVEGRLGEDAALPARRSLVVFGHGFAQRVSRHAQAARKRFEGIALMPQIAPVTPVVRDIRVARAGGRGQEVGAARVLRMGADSASAMRWPSPVLAGLTGIAFVASAEMYFSTIAALPLKSPVVSTVAAA